MKYIESSHHYFLVCIEDFGSQVDEAEDDIIIQLLVPNSIQQWLEQTADMTADDV